MSDKVEKILISIKGIKQVEVKPYFYSRLSSKLENIQSNESFYLKYERPFLIMLVAFMMAINLFFISNNDTNNRNNNIYIYINKNKYLKKSFGQE